MILEAFAEYLHEADPDIHSSDVLVQWLLEMMMNANPKSPIERVIQLEISICDETAEKPDDCCAIALPKSAHILERLTAVLDNMESARETCNHNYEFRGASQSGSRLLKSLDEYSKSYENQKWARWVHQVKASDFKGEKKNNP